MKQFNKVCQKVNKISQIIILVNRKVSVYLSMKIGQSSSISEIKEMKLVMLGSTTVGKTAIVTRLCNGKLFDSTSTVGASFLSKTITVNEETIKFQIWDTSGSERYRSMAPMYFRNADAAIIVYDITSTESFKDVQYWTKEIKEKGSESTLIALAGNKADLDSARVIERQTGERYAQQNGFSIFNETSALTGANINELFEKIALYLINGKETYEPINNRETLNISTTQNEKKDGCC